MKKITLLVALLISSLSFALPKNIPSQCVYIGLALQPQKIETILEKSLQASIYQATLQEIGSASKKILGLNILKDSLTPTGINPQEYINVYFDYNTQRAVVQVIGNSAKMVSYLKKSLNKQWGKVLESKQRGFTKLYNNHPSYKYDVLFYKTEGSSVWFSGDEKSLALIQAKRNPFPQELAQVLQKTKNKPFLISYVPKNTIEPGMLNQMMPADFNEDLFFTLNTQKNQLQLEIFFPSSLDVPQNLNPHPFLLQNPLALIQTWISGKSVLEMVQKLGNPEALFLLNSLDIQNSLGEQIFLQLNRVNAMELMQGNLANIDLLLGVEVKVSAPYESALEMLKNQVPELQQNSQKSFYKGFPLYAYKESSGYGQTAPSLYAIFLKNWILLSTNQSQLEKAADFYLANSKPKQLPLSSKNLLLFVDLAKILQETPMLSGVLMQQGIKADNLGFLSGHYFLEKLRNSPWLNLKLSIFFKR